MNQLPKMVRQVRIGLFLAGAILALALTVLLLGRSQALFRSRVTLYASFANTSGLVEGSPVRLAGVNIGEVEQISLEGPSNAKTVQVTLRIDEDYLQRIREDSFAQLTSRGLLGDMLINITLGSPDKPPLSDGSQIATKEVQGLPQIIAAVESAVATVKNMTDLVDQRLRVVLTDQLAHDIGRIAHSAAGLSEQLERGRVAEAVADILARGRVTAEHVEGTLDHVEHLLAEIDKGSGLVHGLIYGEGGAETVEQLRRTAHELADVIEEVKSGNGIVHSAIYEKDETNLLENLSKASAMLEKIVEDIEHGKGTVGGLLKDPTIYRDLLDVMGEVKRNVLLKALIRMTIKKDKLERPIPEAH